MGCVGCVCVLTRVRACMCMFVGGGGGYASFLFSGSFHNTDLAKIRKSTMCSFKTSVLFFPLLLHMYLNTSYRTSSHALFLGDRSGKKGGSGRWHTGTVQQQRGAVLSDKLLEPRHPGQDVLALWVGHQANSGLGR